MNLTQHFPEASTEITDFRGGSVRIIHITDTHLLDNANEVFHSINTRLNFHRVLSHCLSHHPEIDFVVITGDVSQTGSSSSYQVFHSVISQFEVPIYCVPGNHDKPVYLSRIVPTCPDDGLNIVTIHNINLVLLNSCVHGQHSGRLSAESLHQLESHLKNSDDRLNVLAIHHPPVLIKSKWLDELGLDNRHELLQIINRYPRNLLLLSGHVHQEVDQQLDHLRLLATPSTCHQFKARSDDVCYLEAPMPAYRYIRLGPGGQLATRVHYLG